MVPSVSRSGIIASWTMRTRLERYFEFEKLGARWRTEILAGLTTFVTMAYIVFVNPSILQETGMPYRPLVAATCISAAVGSILMGALARYPIALAPGMGLNAYFAYSVVKGMGVPWQTALGAVFLSGAIFFLLTAVGLRRMIVEAIPSELYAAVAVGIGLFIALVGLRNAGIVVAHPATLVTLGNLRDPNTALALFGLLLIAVLMARQVRGAMLLGILATTAVGAACGLVRIDFHGFGLPSLAGLAGKLDVAGALRLPLAEIVFAFLFIDLFDNLGTLLAVGKQARLFNEANEIPRINRILYADASATMVGAVAGTSTVVSYIESAAGVVAGGRTGIPAIVAGLGFLGALFVAPALGAIPTAATAPALIIVGSLMAAHAGEIRWSEPDIGIPAFLTMVAIPLTFSIANGLAFGFTAFTLVRLLEGRWREVNWLVYLLTALFILRFLYLRQA
jgi:AGZA family xanthine/uracil permease-like MFS transporter